MTRKNRQLQQVAFIGALLLGSAPAGAVTELSLEVLAGYDSNVYNLNESVGVQAGAFTDMDAGFSTGASWPGRWSTIADVGVAARLYQADASDGNTTDYFLRVRGDSNGKKNEHRFNWGLRYKIKDSTYVSHFTGDVATSGGTPIGDRFDSGTLDASVGWAAPDAAAGRISIEASLQAKNYKEDYAALGLDRLDYTAYELMPQYEVGGAMTSFRIRLPVARRQYTDRRARDNAGLDIAGSDLEYTYYGADLRLKHDLSRETVVTLSGDYEDRIDNAVDFGNRQSWSVGGDWLWRPSKVARLSAGARWKSRTLHNANFSNPAVVDESPDKRGYSFGIKGEMPFPGVDARDFTLLGGTDWDSYRNSNDDRYTYNRLQLYVGVKKGF